jgi:hypothetical protein
MDSQGTAFSRKLQAGYDSTAKRLRATQANEAPQTKLVTERRKSTIAAAMVAGALVLAAGCMQTTETDQTLPPYASISDEGREPPKPQLQDDDSPSFMSRLGSAIWQLIW